MEHAWWLVLSDIFRGDQQGTLGKDNSILSHDLFLDKIPPTVSSCPNSTKITSMTSLTRVNWTEPVFVDNVAVVEVLRSHAPGQLFAWGDYVISYIAKDAFSNSATCVFELFVSRKFRNAPLDTGSKFNVHKTFSRCPGRLLNVLYTLIYLLCPDGLFDFPSIDPFHRVLFNFWKPLIFCSSSNQRRSQDLHKHLRWRALLQ